MKLFAETVLPYVASTLLLIVTGLFAPKLYGQARVQAIHNSPYSAVDTVDVYVFGIRAIDDIAFREASAFVELPSGFPLPIDVTDAADTDNSNPIFSTSITFGAGQTYVIVAAGDPLNQAGEPPFDVFVSTALENSAAPGNLSALFFHGSPDAPAVDVVNRLTGDKWGDDLAFGTFSSAYVDLAPGPYALGVSPADDLDESLLARFLAFDAGLADSAVVVLASGFVESEPEIEFIAAFPDGSVSMVPEVTDIDNVRTGDPVGITDIAFEGVVTRAKGRLTYVQDSTAAIATFQSGGVIRDAVDAGAIAEGDSIIISGRRSDFSNLQQIAPANYLVLSRGNALPVPQDLTLAEIAANGENYESELVRVTDLTIDPMGDANFSASRTYGITDPSDASNSVSLRTPSSTDTDIAGVAIPALATFNGVLGQFSSTTPDVGYQLNPVNASDIEAETGVGIEDVEAVPDVFTLLGAYPNPFSGSTIISYTLSETSVVSLTVYDMLGKKVRVLEEGVRQAGRHDVEFEGEDIPSGIYLYRMEAGRQASSKSVIIMK